MWISCHFKNCCFITKLRSRFYYRLSGCLERTEAWTVLYDLLHPAPQITTVSPQIVGNVDHGGLYACVEGRGIRNALCFPLHFTMNLKLKYNCFLCFSLMDFILAENFWATIKCKIFDKFKSTKINKRRHLHKTPILMSLDYSYPYLLRFIKNFLNFTYACMFV